MLQAVASSPDVPNELRAQASALLTKATAVQSEYSLMYRVAFGAQRAPSE
jgi:hypothetical protein